MMGGGHGMRPGVGEVVEEAGGMNWGGGEGKVVWVGRVERELEGALAILC